MNTDSSNQPNPHDVHRSIGDDIMSSLSTCTATMSIEQTLQELQIVVERLTFGSESQEGPLTDADIGMLLGEDVSPGVMRFVNWLHERDLVAMMSGRSGRHMLALCTGYYKNVRQVRFLSPIPLRDVFRTTIFQQLRAKYPEPARIVFETQPSLIAGCVIDDGQKRTDMSLAGQSPAHITEYVASAMRISKGGAQ